MVEIEVDLTDFAAAAAEEPATPNPDPKRLILNVYRKEGKQECRRMAVIDGKSYWITQRQPKGTFLIEKSPELWRADVPEGMLIITADHPLGGTIQFSAGYAVECADNPGYAMLNNNGVEHIGTRSTPTGLVHVLMVDGQEQVIPFPTAVET